MEDNTQRPRQIIEEDLLQIEQSDPISDRFSHVLSQYDQLPDERREILDQVINGKVQQVDEKLKGAEPDLSDEEGILVEKMAEITNLIQELQDRRAQIQKELIPYKKKDLEELIGNLQKEIDFKAVLAYYGPDKKRTGEDILQNAVFQLYQLRRYDYDLKNNSEDDYELIDFRLKTLTSFGSQWREKGFLKVADEDDTISSEPNSIDSETSTSEVLDEVKKTVKTLDEFSKLAVPYKHTSVASSAFDNSHLYLKRLDRIFSPSEDRGYNHLSKIDFDPGLLTALSQQVQELIRTHQLKGHLPQTTEIKADRQRQIDAIDFTKLLSDTSVVGLEERQDMECVVTEGDIKWDIVMNVPPEFLAGLTSIGYKEEDKASRSEQTGGIVKETIGAFRPKFDEDGYLVSSEINVYQSPFVAEGASDRDKLFHKKRFMDTLYHEFGHNAHHQMNYEEIVAWEDTISEDTTAVTWYVKESRKEHERKGKKEDFSESFMLYMRNPALLSILSADRYEFMDTFVVNRLPSNLKKFNTETKAQEMQLAFDVWNKMGYTNEDIREMYLAHEKDN